MTTNWERHFGAPERAAATMAEANTCLKAFADAGDPDECGGCPLLVGGRCDQSAGAWAEWLESEAGE